MKFIQAVLVVVVVLVGGFFLLNNYIYHEKQADGGEVQTEELQGYFAQALFDVGTADGHIPIEGFDAGLLLGKFGGLTPLDFDGVEALQGYYVFEEGELAFVFTEDNEHSAARTISEEGYGTLLENVSVRLEMSVYTETDVASLIDTITIQTRATVSGGMGDTLTALGISVVPQEVIEDSRCPTGVQCVWEGTVRVRGILENELGTTDREFMLGEAVTTETEIITLVTVVPAPQEGEAIEEGNYVFVFEITKR